MKRTILKLLIAMLAATPGAAQYMLLQSGFSGGSARSSGGGWFLEHCTGVAFGGLATGGSYLEAGGFYPIGGAATGVELPQDKPIASLVLPKVLTLCQPYPNPGRASTIKFGLPVSAQVRINVYNILGQQVSSLVDAEKPAGWHTVRWNGRDQSSKPVSNGVYIIRFTAGDKSFTKRAMVLR